MLANQVNPLQPNRKVPAAPSKIAHEPGRQITLDEIIEDVELERYFLERPVEAGDEDGSGRV